MYVILFYDIGERRVQKVHRTLKKYLNWVQNSVFEGELTEGRIEAMKIEVKKHMKLEDDSLIIYQLGSMKYSERDILGVEKNPTGNLL